MLGQWNTFEQIDFHKLPTSFVLKANHGSGTNIIVKNKEILNIKDSKRKFDFWLKMNYAYFMGFELHYRDINKKIIAEKYIEELNGNLYDYKIHCFNGQVEFVQIIGNRNFNTHTANQSFFNRKWEKISFSEGTYPDFKDEIIKPAKWQEMIEIAEVLSNDFSYVRIDLYEINKTVFFGEMTFTPMSGFHKTWIPKDTDLQWGKLLNLPRSKYTLSAKIK